MIDLTGEQKIAHDAMVAFARRGNDGHLTVGGYAGTGKTTVLAAFLRTLREVYAGRVAFACYTGKAAAVLRGKLIATGALDDGQFCGTIHSLMYTPIDPDDLTAGWRRRDEIPADLVIVDEASMVNESIWNDLRSYGVPVIAVGDHGQLPPIEGKFNLMESPHYRLTKIHRQAEGNPIIRLATMARERGEIPFGKHGPGVFKGNFKNDQIVQSVARFGRLQTTLFLSGYNNTRMLVNKCVRKILGAKSEDPMKGDKVICLKNNRGAGIYNGMVGRLMEIKNTGQLFWRAKIKMDDESWYEGNVLKEQFGRADTIREHPHLAQNDIKDLFDFGYCLTVHKAQGSEADSVVLFEERSKFADDDQWRKWLYTGITRARSYLTIVNRRYSAKADPVATSLDKGFQDALLDETR